MELRMINERKICFISCVNNEELYEASKKSIQGLILPEDIEIEFLPMHNNLSMASAYNKAIQLTDAKYKVYMHQDVHILYKKFIYDILKLFQENLQIGIAGMIGSKYLPENGIWWESSIRLGGVYDDHLGKMKEFRYQENDAVYTEAAALDGLLLITQYDVPWREDLFSGWHFYDVSQAIEFQKKSYKAVVLGQRTPWCMHFCGKKIIYNYNIERAKFLAEYGASIKPLVSILIPTYNRPEYFKIALNSACMQTYENLEIIVCDNSTDNRTEKLMEMYKNDSRVRYFRNSEAKTKQENFQPFEKIARGEFLQWLMDDDVLEPNKTEKMMSGFKMHPDITLATSNRRWIDSEGNTLENPLQFNFGDNVDYAIVEGKKMGRMMLLNIANTIGEPSAVLFRRRDLENHYWNADCRGYETISDVVMWLELLQKGNCLCFQHPLSSYRRHGQQEGQQFDVVLKSRLEWMRLIDEEYENKYFIHEEHEYKMALQKLQTDAIECILPVINLAQNRNNKKRYSQMLSKIECILK